MDPTSASGADGPTPHRPGAPGASSTGEVAVTALPADEPATAAPSAVDPPAAQILMPAPPGPTGYVGALPPYTGPENPRLAVIWALLVIFHRATEKGHAARAACYTCLLGAIGVVLVLAGRGSLGILATPAHAVASNPYPALVVGSGVLGTVGIARRIIRSRRSSLTQPAGAATPAQAVPDASASAASPPAVAPLPPTTLPASCSHGEVEIPPPRIAEPSPAAEP